MAESYPNGSKTLREKEKLLVKSNFSFSHSVFKRLVHQTRKNRGLFVKGLNTRLCSRCVKCSLTDKICILKARKYQVGNGENAHIEQAV